MQSSLYRFTQPPIGRAYKDEFIATVERIVVKKEKITVKLDQGWFSEAELKDELHWTT